jgi:hypothetical protein
MRSVRHYFLRGLDHVSAGGLVRLRLSERVDNVSSAEDPSRRRCVPGPAECRRRGRRDPWEMSSLGGRTS